MLCRQVFRKCCGFDWIEYFIRENRYGACFAVVDVTVVVYAGNMHPQRLITIREQFTRLFVVTRWQRRDAYVCSSFYKTEWHCLKVFAGFSSTRVNVYGRESHRCDYCELFV